MTTPRDDRLANLLGAAATGLADAVHAATISASDLDGVGAAALIALLDFSPAGSVHTLSQVVGLTHSGAVRLVDRLVAMGYVERRPGRDARSVTVTLTPSGRAVARRTRAARKRAITQTVGALSDRQRDTLTTLCERLVGELTRHRLRQRTAGDSPPGGALCRMCDFTACGRPRKRCPAQLTAQRLAEVSRFGPDRGR